ncbi:hypothetical protein HID58_092891, partial [Brassica napus]
DGENCRFWKEDWSPFGSLQDYFYSTSASRQGIPIDATLSDLNRSGNWALPRARSEAMLQVQTALTTMSLQEGLEDGYDWIVAGALTTSYKTTDVYWELKGVEAKEPWAAIVCTKGGIPKHSFLVCLNLEITCSSNALTHGESGRRWLKDTPHPIMLASRDLYAVARTQPATSYSAIPVIRYAANCLGSAHKGQNTQLKILFTFALLLPHAEMVCNEAMKARTVSIIIFHQKKSISQKIVSVMDPPQSASTTSGSV